MYKRAAGNLSLGISYKPRQTRQKEGISVTAAAAIVGLRSEALAPYVREGHIQTVGAKQLGARLRLSLDSVQEFHAVYAPAGTFAAALGCPSASAWAVLKRLGINPLHSFAPTKVYRRSEVMLRLGIDDDVIRLTNSDWTVDIAARLQEALTTAMSKCTLRAPSENEAMVTGGCPKTTAKLVFEPASRSLCLRVESDRLGTPRRFKSLERGLNLLQVHWTSCEISGSVVEGRLTLEDRYELGEHSGDGNFAKLHSWLENRMALMRWIFVHGSRAADAQLNA